MFDEMVARIQRTVISVLLKVKIEMRPAPQNVNAAPAANNAAAPAARPVSPRPFRRQMPEPLSNMSSFKAAQNAQADKKDNQ